MDRPCARGGGGGTTQQCTAAHQARVFQSACLIETPSSPACASSSRLNCLPSSRATAHSLFTLLCSRVRQVQPCTRPPSPNSYIAPHPCAPEAAAPPARQQAAPGAAPSPDRPLQKRCAGLRRPAQQTRRGGAAPANERRMVRLVKWQRAALEDAPRGTGSPCKPCVVQARLPAAYVQLHLRRNSRLSNDQLSASPSRCGGRPTWTAATWTAQTSRQTRRRSVAWPATVNFRGFWLSAHCYC